MKRIGIMGGTFDPIHLGHLMLGRQAHEEYGLDSIWYMPSKNPPHKKDHQITSAEDRCAMIEAAIRGIPFFELSDFEMKRAGDNTYTADTLRLLKEEYPEVEFYFIVGADSIHDIEGWYRPGYVLRAVTFLAADRELEEQRLSLDARIQYLTEKYGAKILRLHCMEMDVASADIRSRISSGCSLEDIKTMVPEPVAAYIREQGLYTGLPAGEKRQNHE